MLKVTNLYKSYGKFQAVRDLNLFIPKGEIFGFVGPNGAGKTTTMKIICGLLKQNSGKVEIDGEDVSKNINKLKRKIGYMPDFFGVYDDLKVHEYLEFYASIYGIDGVDRKKVCNDLLDLVNLSEKRDFYVDSLSRGMKQRLCLARCMVHNPELLVLDEPASGMDPRARVEMKDILRTLKNMGKTILISSHILPELAELCTMIGIIEKGHIALSGSVEDIEKKVYHSRTVRIKILDKMDEAGRLVKECPEIDEIRIVSDKILEVDFRGNNTFMNKLLVKLVSNNIPVVTYDTVENNLEDIFMKVIENYEEA
ncbi:ABC transporter ATP-binding protein [Clostridium oryzae]|uniref:Putative ABC transporter ATP-binding protein YbhF n=1 Tax=Clostridium oryzae TaxID=1450648 RepID=A0A1V4IT22_9CLOT|nr:ABC transporter ATP-binding protein [Clostridium oryzae]OPJ63076.1 putative ABC transporter ATP-binding protein YbhF [Clostridium oryzae]